MRVLFVTPRLPYLPCHEAARLAASHLVEHLATHHTVAIVPAPGGGDTPARRAWLASRAAVVETVPGGRWRRALSGRPADALGGLDRLVRWVAGGFAPDVIHLEGALLAPLARAAAAPTVLACHESATLRARDVRRAGSSAWRRLAARLDERVETTWARTWFGAATACVVESEDDRRALAEHVALERVEVIPARLDDAKPAAPRAVAGARRLAGAILPRVRRDVPRAELLLAGTDGTADAARALGALPGVRVSGSLGDLRASVWGAAVYVSPLDAGFGRTARLLEPMALGTPVVASHATLSGLPGVVAGQHVLGAESDEEFARAVRRLLREPLLANTLARNARQLVERRFTWRTVAERYGPRDTRLAPP